MSQILQKLTQEGQIENIPSGRRVRIYPQLRAPNGEVYKPDSITVGSGFLLVGKDNGDGTFDAQNVTTEAATLQWTATKYFTTQYQEEDLQSTVGPPPGADPSPEDPVALLFYPESFFPTAQQGEILYKGETEWELLPVGTDGQFLRTRGADNDPIWDAPLPAGEQGDVLYHDGNDWTPLAHGVDGQCLTTKGAGADPIWDDPLPTGNKGDLFYYDGNNWTPFVPGVAGRILQTNGPGNDPTWVVPGGGGGKNLAPVVVIGSANSAPTADTLADCDYLHDNTNLPADDAFAAAIAFLNGFGGGTIYVRRGWYALPNNVDYILDNIVIIGEGKSPGLGTTIYPEWCVHGDTPYLKLTGYGSGLQNLDLIIPNTFPFPYSTGAVWIDGESCWMENVVMRPCDGLDADLQWGAVYVTGTNTRIENCDILGLYGVSKVWGACIALDNADGVIIENCYLLNDYGVAGAVDIGGSQTYTGSKRVSIKNCYIYQNQSSGIGIIARGVTNPLEDIQIIGNVIQGKMSLSSTHLHGLNNSIVEQNRIFASGGGMGLSVGGYIFNCSFSNNIIKADGAGGQGIVFEGDNGNLDNKICGNEIQFYSAYGIRVKTPNQMQIQGNIIRSDQWNSVGIYVYETPFDVNITGNIIRQLGEGGTLQSGGIRVEDNAAEIVCNDNNIYSIQNSPCNGIRFANTVIDSTINGNKVVIASAPGAQLYGIFVNNTCNKITCVGNRVKMSNGTSIFMDGGGAATNGTCVGNSVTNAMSLGAGIQASSNDTA